MESHFGSVSTERDQVCHARTIPVASGISEVVVHQPFDKMFHKEIEWDEMSSDCDTHVGLLQLVAIGAEYLFRIEMEPISKVNAGDKIPHVSGVLHPSELSMDAVNDVFDMHLEDVVTGNSENGLCVASVLGNSDAQAVFDEMALKFEVAAPARHLFGDIPIQGFRVRLLVTTIYMS